MNQTNKNNLQSINIINLNNNLFHIYLIILIKNELLISRYN